MSAPHLDSNNIATTSRRGYFWVAGEPVATDYGTAQRGPMFVEWESPVQPSFRCPIVLVHGGGGQGTDWLTTPDGRPGWSRLLVEAGFAVYVVDRPGHGRSPHHPDVLGAAGPPFGHEMLGGLFAPSGQEELHSEWPWGRGIGDAELDQLASSAGFMLADLAEAQSLDSDRLARLLDQIGPAILMTHSAGAPAGWLTAARRPQLVEAIVAIEPMGPPFGAVGPTQLTWGITHAPINYEPPVEAADELHDGTRRSIPGLVNLPITVVTGGASVFASLAPPTVEFLNQIGARAEWMHLPDHGITGNGHGLMLERNSSETIVPVIEWIKEHQ